MRVLGIDPGLTRCGLGVVDGQLGRPPSLVAVGVIRTPADLDLPRRLLRLESRDRRLDQHRTVRMRSPSSGSSPSTTCRR